MTIFSDIFFLVEKDETFFKNYFQIFVLLFAHYESSFLEYVGHIIISGPKITFFLRPISSAWMMLMNFPDIFYFYYKPLEANKRSCLDTYFWTNEQMCHLTCFHIF